MGWNEDRMFEKFEEVMKVVDGMDFVEFSSVWCMVLETMSEQNGRNVIDTAGNIYSTICQMNK